MSQPAQQEKRGQLVLVPKEPPQEIAKLYDIDQPKWNVLKDVLYPTAKSPEIIGLVLAQCKVKGYDPFTKPYHIAVVTVDGKEVEQIWPAHSQLVITAHRTGLFVGIDEIEYGPQIKFYNKMVPEWAKATVWRWAQGAPRRFETKVFFEERAAVNYKGNLVFLWAKAPKSQIGKCASAAALRLAFPEELGSVYCHEEMEGQTIAGEMETPEQMVNKSVAEKRASRETPTVKATTAQGVAVEIKEEMRQDQKDIAQSQLEVANAANNQEAAAAAQEKLDALKGISPPQSLEINKAITGNNWPMKKAIDFIAEKCGIPEGKRSEWPKFVTEEKRLEILEHFKTTPYVEDTEVTE